MADLRCPHCQALVEPDRARMNHLRSAVVDTWRDAPYGDQLGKFLHTVNFMNLLDDTIQAILKADTHFSQETHHD